jgi:hypothetical protein
MQTFWLVADEKNDNDTTAGSSSCTMVDFDTPFVEFDGPDNELTASKPEAYLSRKIVRLVDWNTEVLLKLMKKVVARRGRIVEEPYKTTDSSIRGDPWVRTWSPSETILSEVKEIIALPACRNVKDNVDDIAICQEVQDQLRHYIGKIASHYKDNRKWLTLGHQLMDTHLVYCSTAFHSFEHASHVTNSVVKMMVR